MEEAVWERASTREVMDINTDDKYIPTLVKVKKREFNERDLATMRPNNKRLSVESVDPPVRRVGSGLKSVELLLLQNKYSKQSSTVSKKSQKENVEPPLAKLSSISSVKTQPRLKRQSFGGLPPRNN